MTISHPHTLYNQHQLYLHYWIIIAALVIWSSIKRYLYKKQLEEFNKEFQRKTEEKRKTYYNQEQYYRGNEDIIDVDYKEYEDD